MTKDNNMESTEGDTVEKQNPKLTILKVKRKRTEHYTESIVLEERPSKYTKQFNDTLAAFTKMGLNNTDTNQKEDNTKTTSGGRKLFRYIGTSKDHNDTTELLSGHALSKRLASVKESKQMNLPKQQRITLQQNTGKKGRFLTVNKLRKIESNTSQHSVFELVPTKEEKKAKTTIILDDAPKNTFNTDTTDQDEIYDFYYLDDELLSHDEVTDTTIVPVESFSAIYDDNALTLDNEYDEDLNAESSDSQNFIEDYPDTPDEDREENPWKDDTSEANSEEVSSEDGTRGYGSYKFKHGYDPRDSNEEYDEYI